jgi:hypothetical protein
MTSMHAVGDLDFATTVSCYEPRLDMHLPTARPFGLTEHALRAAQHHRDFRAETQVH